MIRLLQSPWTASLIGMIAYLSTMVALWRPHALPPVSQHDDAAAAPRSPGPSWTFHNPEVDVLMAELRKQKETIALKEKELTDLAARLQAERAELSQMTQAVQRVQSEFDRNVARIQEQETTNLKRLAKLYSTMTPEGAAAVFKALDDSTLVKVLAHMKDADMAPVLEILARQGEADAKRVAAISEQLRMLLPATTTKTP